MVIKIVREVAVKVQSSDYSKKYVVIGKDLRNFTFIKKKIDKDFRCAFLKIFL